MVHASLPGSPWFESDDFETRFDDLRITPELRDLVRKYRRDGYLILEQPVVDDAMIDDAVAKLAGRYVGAATGYDDASRVQDAWQTIASVKRIATAPKVTDVLSILYQRDPIPFQTLNFERGTQQKAHSDTIHFNSLPYGFMCGVWVALQDVDADCGPLFYYKGSHRLPVFHMSDLGLTPGDANYSKYEDAVEKILASQSFEKEHGILKKGQAIIWSANLFHGGSRVNRAGSKRLSQVTHYYFPGTFYYTPLASDPLNNEYLFRYITDIRTGQEVPRLRFWHASQSGAGEGLVARAINKARRKVLG